MHYLKEIIFLLGDDKRKLAWMILLFLCLSILDLAGIGLVAPYVSLILDENAIDGFLGEAAVVFSLPTEQHDLLVLMGSILVAVFAIKSSIAIWANAVIIKFGQNRLYSMRTSLMSSYQNMSYTSYIRRNSSEYINNIQNLAVSYATGVIIPLMRMVSDGVVAIVILMFLIYADPMALFLLATLFGTVIIVYDRIFRRHLRSYGERANEGARSVVQGVHEGLEGFKEIRILGTEQYFHSMVDQGAKDFAIYNTKKTIIASAPRYLIELLLILFIFAFVFITITIGGDIQSIAPIMALFAVAAMRLLPMVSIFSSGLTTLRFYRDSVSQLYKDMQDIDGIEKMSTDMVQHHDPFRILKINNIFYRYPNSEYVALQDISLQIKAGESVGFIGSSGSGKTTLIDVLLGLLLPRSGRIEYNDAPLQENLLQWRSQIAYLPQHVFLVDTTLRSNVALGIKEEHIDDERLQQALSKARLSEVVEQLPNGVNTLLGERGVRLSGGQRQRVALARAFYHGRDILVMDEATSALDNETEREIVEEIQRLKGKITMIVIAHRLTTVEHCDRVYKVEQGKIVDVNLR